MVVQSVGSKAEEMSVHILTDMSLRPAVVDKGTEAKVFLYSI